MKRKNNLLQLFAMDGSAADTGVTGADAGHTELAAQGDSAALRRAESAIPSGRAEAVQDAAAQGSKEEAEHLTWEKIKADPRFNEKMQQLVQARLKTVKKAQTDLDTLTPALQSLAGDYGMDPEKLDYAALTEAILSKKQAASVPPARQTAPQGAEVERNVRSEGALRRHFDALVEQAAVLRQRIPDFDLAKELQDPAFLRLTAPHGGVSVEHAYYTLHRDRLQQETAQQISNAIRAGTLRPRENGTGRHGPSLTAFDYRNAGREQREALKKAIRAAGARGEKLYPGETGL